MAGSIGLARARREAKRLLAAHAPRMTALLLSAGADPDDNESLYHAVEAPDTRCLRLLLDSGATVARTNALPNALGRRAPETVRLLLAHLPAGHHERRWALHWPIAAGESPEVVRLLVEHGADLEALDEGRGPDALRARDPHGTARPRRVAGRAGRGAPGRTRRRADRRRLRRRPRGGRAARRRRPAVARARPHRVRGRARAGGRRRATGGRPDPARPGRAGRKPRRAGWRAQAAYLRLLATSAEVAARTVGDGVAVLSGLESNAENGIVCRREPGDLAELLAWLAAPAQWLLAPPTEPPDLLDRLVAAGAVAERTAVVMGADLGSVPTPGVIAPDVRIVAVRDRAQLEGWMEIAQVCRFVDPGVQRERWAEIVASIGLQPGGPLQHRLAVVDGDPVGVGAVLLDGSHAALRHLAVLPIARRAGVGRALMAHLAAEARRAGARHASLGPTPESIPFYRGCGFVLRPDVRDRILYLP